MKQIIYSAIMTACMILVTPTTVNMQTDNVIQNREPMVTHVVEAHAEPTVSPVVVDVVMAEESEAEQYDFIYEVSDEEIELIALLTMAEAEGESEEGQRLVIDTILNRVESDLSYFPDTVYKVIYQKNAFESLQNGRVDRCNVTEELCELVREELQSRTNYDVLYFTAGKYGKYGSPMFSVGNHYFSGE